MRTTELTEDIRSLLNEFFGGDPVVQLPPPPTLSAYSAKEWGLGPGNDGAAELNLKLDAALKFVHERLGLMTPGSGIVAPTKRLGDHANNMIRQAWFKKLKAAVEKYGAAPDFALAKLLDYARDITGMKNLSLQGSWLRQLVVKGW